MSPEEEKIQWKTIKFCVGCGHMPVYRFLQMTIYSNSFSNISFWHKKFITKSDKESCGFFEIQVFKSSVDSLFSILKIYRILLLPFMYIFPEQLS